MLATEREGIGELGRQGKERRDHPPIAIVGLRLDQSSLLEKEDSSGEEGARSANEAGATAAKLCGSAGYRLVVEEESPRSTQLGSDAVALENGGDQECVEDTAVTVHVEAP